MALSDEKGKIRSKKVKVSFWFDCQLTHLLDKAAEKYGLSRSDFIRLTLREALTNRGLLHLKQEALYQRKRW